ncbi:MAG TPA: hypothetical protein VJ785_01065 [Anaerolineales bacterium]|nr:hypothetical protein [Anaerolineales bacterium]
MTAFSILGMNSTLRAREYAMDDHLSKLPSPTHYEPLYYWHIERKSRARRTKGEQKWVFVRDFAGTKADVADLWNRYFRTGEFRLRCQLKYSSKREVQP